MEVSRPTANHVAERAVQSGEDRFDRLRWQAGMQTFEDQLALPEATEEIDEVVFRVVQVSIDDRLERVWSGVIQMKEISVQFFDVEQQAEVVLIVRDGIRLFAHRDLAYEDLQCR